MIKGKKITVLRPGHILLVSVFPGIKPMHLCVASAVQYQLSYRNIRLQVTFI